MARQTDTDIAISQWIVNVGLAHAEYMQTILCKIAIMNGRKKRMPETGFVSVDVG